MIFFVDWMIDVHMESHILWSMLLIWVAGELLVWLMLRISSQLKILASEHIVNTEHLSLQKCWWRADVASKPSIKLFLPFIKFLSDKYLSWLTCLKFWVCFRWQILSWEWIARSIILHRTFTSAFEIAWIFFIIIIFPLYVEGWRYLRDILRKRTNPSGDGQPTHTWLG